MDLKNPNTQVSNGKSKVSSKDIINTELSENVENQPFEGPLAQALLLIEDATELRHKTAFLQWASQCELEPEPHFKRKSHNYSLQTHTHVASTTPVQWKALSLDCLSKKLVETLIMV